jgi:hypothetical protein
MPGKRNFAIIGVGENEFLVQAEDEGGEDLRVALGKLLPQTTFELQPVNEKRLATLRSRLTDQQHDLIKRLSKSVDSAPKRGSSYFRLQLTGEQRLAAAANLSGAVKFDPQVSRIRKPLGGGIGPVGVTVGIGIAGKF